MAVEEEEEMTMEVLETLRSSAMFCFQRGGKDVMYNLPRARKNAPR